MKKAKKLLALTLCIIMVFGLTGCVSGEIGEIMEKNAAAEAKYSMVEYISHVNAYVYNETADHIMTFEQDELSAVRQLVRSGDRIAHTTYTTNAGTDIEETSKYSYYQRGRNAYFNLEEKGLRYRQRSRQSNVNDFLSDIIDGLTESDFKSIRVTDMEDGGKRLRFRLDPKAIATETANDFLLAQGSFLPNGFGITGAELMGFEFTLTLDKEYLTRKQEHKADILLHLENGSTASWRHEESFVYKKYSYLENDHLVFPEDLADYPDYDTLDL
ncbi:MAG: hypothetical protein FWG94_03375 [Oscillospiraceae bacterium]|nr:hypothetical protein [Oscillospiraceae bacterium]